MGLAGAGGEPFGSEAAHSGKRDLLIVRRGGKPRRTG